ncbi:UDP-glucuronosyltransferase 2B14 [Tetrabaena socialis]|uniref:UDP-glucuronosyltransferase 2B14 n=1 Tax=Tetrabaena socialis TaxID=47790 RepID=A0A2J7ZHV0_9CHLO|nr:UDP-glucuronosyltransferase 2B14 [Tetrabaena socialis]|eukprot:PNG99843.1 UDP-glucuronosyltransferase 2B14 [Tetrabaena socialis]
MLLRIGSLRVALCLLACLSVACSATPTQLLVFTGVHREQALDVWALAEHLSSSRDLAVTVLVPDSLARELKPSDPSLKPSDPSPLPDAPDTADGASCAAGEASCAADEATRALPQRSGSLTTLVYASLPYEEYSSDAMHGRGALAGLTAQLDFHLANCANLLLNRTVADALAHGAAPSSSPGASSSTGSSISEQPRFAAMLGVATDPCSALLADRLRIRRRVSYDDGASVSLLLTLLGAGHATSHVAAYGTALGGGGAMSTVQRVRNVVAYHRLQWWHARVFEPRVAAFRQRHRLQPHTADGPKPPACHLRGQVVITGADWGLLEPQPLPPSVQLVGPLRARAGAEGPLQPPQLAAHVAAAEQGVVVIAFPDDYSLYPGPRGPEPDIARVYLPLKHARNVLMLPELPLSELLAHPQVVSLVTAGSVQAIYQAIYHAKPVMAVPLSSGQEDVVARVAALGAGQRLSRTELEGGAASYRVSVAIERMRNVYS